MTLNEFRELVNLKLYKSKTRVLRFFRVMSVIVSILAVASLVYYHGFHTSLSEQRFITSVFKWAFGFYILKYSIRIIYSFEPLKDIKETIFEGSLMLIIVLNFLLAQLFGWSLIHSVGDLMGLANLEAFFLMVIQAYFVLILANEIGRGTNLIGGIDISPPTMLISSFFVLISLGCGVLLLPEMTVTGESMPFLDALFTSISASCVTGLIVVDTANFFSYKGQFVIMMLIQLGGLNIISFATIFALFVRNGIGIKHQSIIQESLNVDSLSDSRDLFRQIFVFSILIELIGATLIFFSWDSDIGFVSTSEKVFFSVFHSISAFNNAGFSTFSNGLYENLIATNYTVHIVIAGLVVLGGLGFAVLRDLFSLKKYKERKDKPWTTYKIDTKISLYAAGILILAGFTIFMLFESGNTLSGKSLGERIITSIFQSITTRTAGFNTVDIGSVTTPALIFIIFLMFIGASPGSTGGGIKTNTFALVSLGAWSTTRGKERLELFKHTIPYELLNKAFLIFLFTLAFISLGIFGLAIAEPDLDLIALSFEEVSAFCTVGLSTGITADLSTPARIIIMVSMFIGRVGTLSLAFALGRKKRTNDYKYPKATIMIG
jgi:potassium uptake TrkH family protein